MSRTESTTHPYYYADADGNEKMIECDGTFISDCRICHPRPVAYVNAYTGDVEDDDCYVKCSSCGHVHADHLRCR